MPHAGYYGKIPVVGDFVKYNLGRAFIEPWDDWLQTAITHSRQQMGESWLQSYLTSPIYRYVLTSGICGEQAWKGVIMPSVDRVGRYFPLTVCAPLNQSENPFICLLEQETWFERAEHIVLSTLEDDLTLEQLQNSLTTLDKILDAPESSLTELPPGNNSSLDLLAIRSELPPTEDASNALFPELLNQVLLQSGFAYSLWRTEGSDRVAPSLLLSQGFPPGKSVGAMLDGHWSDWGWSDNQPISGLITSVDEDTYPWDM